MFALLVDSFRARAVPDKIREKPESETIERHQGAGFSLETLCFEHPSRTMALTPSRRYCRPLHLGSFTSSFLWDTFSLGHSPDPTEPEAFS
jgi:hypothetical protein